MIEQLAKQLINDVQSALGGSDAESTDPSKLKALIESALRKLNLVSREEFDAQTAVLQRTRAKLEAMEEKLAELESASGKR